MQYVQPIRDLKKIEQIKQILKDQNERDYMLFLLGINTGLRVSDLLRLRVDDVRGQDIVIIKEQKTGKTRRVRISKPIKQEVSKYTRSMSDDDVLFKSRKGNNSSIGRTQAYRILSEAARQVGLDEIGTHTLRKTFGYWHYQKNKDMAVLQNILNHSSPAMTMRYIGINDDLIDQSLEGFCL
ncbi:Phage integrase, site-specific tyrosine recombinase [Candidatus Syntrophocurvum alkaliphilum]|uniref:Phage integrase, site-specific tyrosine recombinase n=1 Tax=Candidatus Syntrophocurvum alkaliphilum TaxID=2293317 RepID=A0A6I6DDM7_9FIRM|nr:site-specific integrase [Candidatus Syntrophocurvum alkaliphilum]QGT99307.1 Phage integrase, site-specific tyrosine recombinase [Candidatus Syntrophocurvum alkaliphilum]